MPALRVAIDLTQLEQRADRPLDRSLPLQFTERLIEQAPDTPFAVLARPDTRAALAHLEGLNGGQVAVAEVSPSRSVLARSHARVWQRLRRGRFARSVARLEQLGPLVLPTRPGPLARLGMNVVFCPFISSGLSDPSVPLVLAIDDLQHLSHPHLLDVAERIAHAQAIEATCRVAARIVCSTPSLGEVAVHGAGVVAGRVTSLAPGRLLARLTPTQPTTAAALARYGLAQNQFLLFVGDFEARHNHRLTLAALAIFRARQPQSEMRLVCVGGSETGVAEFRRVAAQMKLGEYVHFPGALGPAETTALMRGCRAVLVPSLYETVGQSVLEGMQLGRPLLCSAIPGLLELTGDAGLTFDPHRPTELAEVFERAEREPALLDHLAQRGRERVARFDDARGVAEGYLGVFREALSTCLPSR